MNVQARASCTVTGTAIPSSNTRTASSKAHAAAARNVNIIYQNTEIIFVNPLKTEFLINIYKNEFVLHRKHIASPYQGAVG
jgi:hypothetical protein